MWGRRPPGAAAGARAGHCGDSLGCPAGAGELVPLAEGGDGKGKTEQRLTSSGGPGAAPQVARPPWPGRNRRWFSDRDRRVSLSSHVFVLSREEAPCPSPPKAPKTPFLGALTFPRFRSVEGNGLEGTWVAPRVSGTCGSPPAWRPQDLHCLHARALLWGKHR